MAIQPYLQLARPANVVTAFADILAGCAASGALVSGPVVSGLGDDLALLLVSTAGLYAGGVVFNDVFDADLDARERPERPIPSGRVSQRAAALFGSVLIAAGIGAAALVGPAPLAMAALVAAGALFYDAVGKHHPVLGPLNMGACRGGNLLLGASILPAALPEIAFLAVLPIAYIAAVTAISRGEVHGGLRATGVGAVALATGVMGSLLLLGLRVDYRTLPALPFLALFAGLVLPPFVRAALDPTPPLNRAAVRAGVLSLVAMDATLAAGFGGWIPGLAVAILLPLSIGIAKLFAVT